MSDTYAILGFSETTEGPEVMFEGDSSSECDRWRETYTRFGDWGGYDCLALYEIAPGQSALFIHMNDAPIITWERETA